MLDIEKLRVECSKTIHSHSAEFLQEWIDTYNKRVKLAELEKKNRSHINGTAKRKTTQPRAVNGRFVSKEVEQHAVAV